MSVVVLGSDLEDVVAGAQAVDLEIAVVSGIRSADNRAGQLLQCNENVFEGALRAVFPHGAANAEEVVPILRSRRRHTKCPKRDEEEKPASGHRPPRGGANNSDSSTAPVGQPLFTPSPLRGWLSLDAEGGNRGRIS